LAYGLLYGMYVTVTGKKITLPLGDFEVYY
jgi:hypothetical protein